jgi:hypothetical protein
LRIHSEVRKSAATAKAASRLRRQVLEQQITGAGIIERFVEGLHLRLKRLQTAAAASVWPPATYRSAEWKLTPKEHVHHGQLNIVTLDLAYTLDGFRQKFTVVETRDDDGHLAGLAHSPRLPVIRADAPQEP